LEGRRRTGEVSRQFHSGFACEFNQHGWTVVGRTRVRYRRYTANSFIGFEFMRIPGQALSGHGV